MNLKKGWIMNNLIALFLLQTIFLLLTVASSGVLLFKTGRLIVAACQTYPAEKFDFKEFFSVGKDYLAKPFWLSIFSWAVIAHWLLA